MKNISADKVRESVTRLIDSCLVTVDNRVTEKLAALDDDAPSAVTAARLIAKNNEIARSKHLYACQDTGQAVFLIRLGDGVSCPGLHDALVSATRDAYAQARKSVADPITRLNTSDNTPPIIETEIVSGDGLEISFLAKGAGSENMTRLYMLKPADGATGIVDSIVDAVQCGGRNACPPLIIGVGIGGVSETACTLAKRALLRPLGDNNDRADIADLERAALSRVNALGIGVASFGGKTTALAVKIEAAPTHIGMLPVAVNLQCHSLRHGTVTF